MIWAPKELSSVTFAIADGNDFSILGQVRLLCPLCLHTAHRRTFSTLSAARCIISADVGSLLVPLGRPFRGSVTEGSCNMASATGSRCTVVRCWTFFCSTSNEDEYLVHRLARPFGCGGSKEEDIAGKCRSHTAPRIRLLLDHAALSALDHDREIFVHRAAVSTCSLTIVLTMTFSFDPITLRAWRRPC
ncbi:hypothetical protein LIPSTDRAFT_224485 [Lipomyces starkeyi NRRL Y-11557]|uniref:Uncharacterized protein n=1 Tax=Lipomyces starkeyi NRRL Y-11557 TaxID=675824 RepID=A0A1E3PTY9_LIPST|nr:hypothetical protein LIPSTDRAFT_224485 [Lipomyces starkeyi NRRL Y-11557]